jgi:hypothetical protein
MNEEIETNEPTPDLPSEPNQPSKSSETAPTSAPEAAAPAVARPQLPDAICINEFRLKPLSEIYSLLEALPVKIPAKASKSQLVF